MDSSSFLPVLRGESQGHENLFWSHDIQRAVRSGDWKLILNPPKFPGDEVSDRVWLSNLEADPSERKNLADVERERVRVLTERIREWELRMRR